MDLHAMLNTEGAGASRQRGQQPPQAGAPPPAMPMPPAPSTPGQHGPPLSHNYREYPHAAHASPTQAHEYPPRNPSQPAPNQYASPTNYHPPAQPFHGRPSVPPLQPPGPADPRSPGSASMSGPSPYRPTPTSSQSAASGGYPFPPTQGASQPPASPVQQRVQYGTPQGYPGHQGPPGPGTPGSGPYVQQHPHQQYPPSHQQHPQQQIHQRSHSIQSTPTPTSAQHPSYNAPPFGSPVAATQPGPHQRQGSQPLTPLGPPPRQSPAMSYQQPPSPYQQRASYPTQGLAKQTSPPSPHRGPVQRTASNSTNYDILGDSRGRSQSHHSHSEREHSTSVSPKTRVPSLPNSTSSGPPHTPQSLNQAPPQPHVNAMPMPMPMPSGMESHSEVTPAKRKLDHRELGPDELQGNRPPPPAPTMNGHHAAAPSAPTRAVPPKKPRYTKPPIWAQDGRNQSLSTSRNYSLKHRRAPGGDFGAKPAINGSNGAAGASRYSSPEASRGGPGAIKAESAPAPAIPNGPVMEPCITNVKPIEAMNKAIGDFLFHQVLRNANGGEIQSRNVLFEIEAKFGTIIDKSTNDRVFYPIQAGECIISPMARVGFRSAMSESQHKKMNEFLNAQVTAAHPKNPKAKEAGRLEIKYKHRRETDRFFELPQAMVQRLPFCVASSLVNKHQLKARVTYDQDNNVLAKIIKGRVGDLHIHLPHHAVDCRLSVNLEWDWDGPAEEIIENQMPNRERLPDRNKDRLSYTHGCFQVDLTQVTQNDDKDHKDHELEVELDATTLLQQGNLLQAGQPNKFGDLIDGLSNNIRVLSREVVPE